jgi:hypothetical protein
MEKAGHVARMTEMMSFGCRTRRERGDFEYLAIDGITVQDAGQEGSD